MMYPKHDSHDGDVDDEFPGCCGMGCWLSLRVWSLNPFGEEDQ